MSRGRLPEAYLDVRSVVPGASAEEVIHVVALAVPSVDMSSAVAGCRWCREVVDGV